MPKGGYHSQYQEGYYLQDDKINHKTIQCNHKTHPSIIAQCVDYEHSSHQYNYLEVDV
jgi:hypothetical protein